MANNNLFQQAGHKVKQILYGKDYDFEQIFDRYRRDPDIVIRSKEWFNQQSKLLSTRNINERNLFKNSKTVDKILPGRFYLYYYDPKHKKTLPYYDTFPLVIPFRAMPDGFIGLNFHYLGYYQRIRLLTLMMKFATHSSLDPRTRLMFTWSLINNVAKFKIAKHCVKRYLFSHVRSRYIEIEPDDWHTAMMLPVARFVGRKQEKIWQDNIQ